MRFALCVAALVVAVSSWAVDCADCSMAEFPRLAGEADDTARIRRAIQAVGPDGVLYFPRGTYEVSSQISVTNGASLLLHKSATVRAVAKMPYIFWIDLARAACWRGPNSAPGVEHDCNFFFKGGHLDGNGLSSCLALKHYFHFVLRDVTFLNGFPYGLHVCKGGAEIIGNNLYFRTVKKGLAGNTAFFTEGNDSQYSDCVAVDYTVGFDVQGAANVFSRIHSWGGPVPPRPGAKIPEMLENSVCFRIGGHKNAISHAYADTAVIGFDVSGWGHVIDGAWFLNNASYKLRKMTVVRQAPDSTAVVFDNCVFHANTLETKGYEGPGTIKWSNVVWKGFAKPEELPPGLDFSVDCACDKADDFEFLPGGKVWTFASPAGEFVKESARGLVVPVPAKAIERRFPKAGQGAAVVVRIRATTPETKAVELTLSQTGGKTWGLRRLDLTADWQEVRIPFSRLEYFKNWSKAKIAEGEQPDARQLTCVRFLFGTWLCDGTAEAAHGFEVGSVRIVGR